MAEWSKAFVLKASVLTYRGSNPSLPEIKFQKMPIKKYKPITPSQRGLNLIDKSNLSNDKPVKSLTKGLNKKGGRNNQGKITSFKKSGGHKSKYRKVDFKRKILTGISKPLNMILTVLHLSQE